MKVVYLLLFAILTGCGGVYVNKIPTKSQYAAWNDNKQAQADAIQGVRYYLPRPFVAVNKEFAYNSETFLVHGRLSSDGKHISIDQNQHSAINTEIPELLNFSHKIPFESVYVKKIATKASLEGNDSNPTVQLQGGVSGIPLGAPISSTKPQFDTAQVEIVDKTATWNAAMDYSINGPNSSLKLEFTLSKDTTMADLKKSTIREIFLVPIKNGQPNESEKITLPIEFYNGDGTYSYKGILPGIKSGLHALGVTFLSKQGTLCLIRKHVANPNKQNMIDVGSASDAVNYGEDDKSNVITSEADEKIIIKTNRQLTKAIDSRISFKVNIANTTETQLGTAFKKVTKITLAPIKSDGSLDLTKEQPLPFDIIKKGDTNAWEYDIQMKESLPVGKYHVALHVDADTLTYILTSKNAVVESQDITTETIDSICTPINPEPPVSNKPPTNNSPTAPNKPNQASGNNSSSNQDKPAVPGQPTQQSETTKESVKSQGGKMTIKALANPDTKPVTDINELFKVVYLPDFDEQYAVSQNARLSFSEFELSLENGWMMENYSETIDNRAIANFIFFQIGETLDLVRDIVRIDKKLLAAVTGDASDPDDDSSTEKPSLEGGDGETKVYDKKAFESAEVLLKIHKIEYAVPGLYPILKPREIIESKGYGKKPSSNHSVLRFNTRVALKVELVKLN